MMGSEDEHANDRESPIHSVSLDNYYMGRYPVTQALWCKIMDSENNPSWNKGSKRPVDKVNWYEAIEFCNKLSKEIGRTPYYKIDKSSEDPGNQNDNDQFKYMVSFVHGAKGFRLPTEAEWEYAAAGGTYQSPFRYAGSDKLSEVGWYAINSHRETKDVGKLHPNALGLYDMSGNVEEWCWDWYKVSYYKDCYDEGIVHDPIGPEQGLRRIFRGGYWAEDKRNCRVVYRYRWSPWLGPRGRGFRLACASA